jgi:hypothetical protein
MVAGARVVTSAQRETAVWVAAHDLAPGERITAGDLTTGRVRLTAAAGHYLAARTPPVGYVLDRFVGRGELLPASALAAGGPDTTRLVTVPVSSGHLPPALGPGAVVDVYVSPRPGGAAAAPTPTSLVLAGATVQSREGGSRSIGGESTLSVVLVVAADAVPALVRAVESGVLDLVEVPAHSGSADRQ